MNLKGKRITVTGGAGFLGSQIVKLLEEKGCDIVVPRRRFYDLRTDEAVDRLFRYHPADIVIHAAAHAGGIGLNQAKPGELFYDNALMGIQLMDAARKEGVEKFVQLGTICEYPKFAIVPFLEEELWDGFPEDTNAPYAIAKKSLLVMGQAYRQQYGMNVIHLLPVNLYGPGDNFDPATSHVIPALIRKLVDARDQGFTHTPIWGDGTASREFLYVEDCAKAVVQATELYDEGEPINIGTGFEISVKDLANLIAKMVDYKGQTCYDTNRPNGQPRRCLDVEKAREKFNFVSSTPLEVGLQKTIDWFYKHRIEFQP
jgi:GDP-L-fucose synthase